MAHDEAHPALHSAPAHTYAPDGGHYVPEAWEDWNIGLCPCGEAVRWDDTRDRWAPDRSIRVLVLDRDEAEAVRSLMGAGPLGEVIRGQLDLQAFSDEADR